MKKEFLRKTCLPILMGLLVLACFIVAGCSQEKTKKPEVIKIGILAPLSGDAASWGEAAKEGYDLAVEQVNMAGGISGRSLEPIYEDTQAQPEKAASAMLKLATVDKVPAVLGSITSAATLAAAPIAEKNHVVLLSPTSSAPKLSKAGKYIFRIWPSDTAEGSAIADFAASKMNLKHVDILYIQNDYGLALKDVFQRVFTNKGGIVPVTLAYKQDETDFRPYLSRIAADKPDAVYLVSYYKDAAMVFKQARELGLDLQFLGTTALEDPKLIELAGTAAEGVIYAIPAGFDPKGKDPTVTAFVMAFKKKFGKEPGIVAAHTYDAMNIIASVMKKGAMDGPAIQQALENLKGYHGVTGVISFDENGDVVKDIHIKTIKDGRFVDYTK